MLSIMWFVTGVVLLINTLLWSVYIAWWGVFGLVPVAAAFFLCRLTSGRETVDDPAIGWDIGEGIDIDNPDQPRKVRVVLEDNALNLGMLAIGGPMSGKTVMAIGFLHYLDQHRQGGWAYWEGKGDREIYQQVCACGAKPDRFFSTELPHSDTVNIFAGPTENVIDRLTRTLISDESEYYGNAQRAAIRKVVPLLKSLGTPVSLQDLYVTLILPEAAMYVLNQARQKQVPATIIEAARLFFDIEEGERMNQINGLLNRMDIFVTGSIAGRINAYAPTLDLSKAAAEGQKVYLHMPYGQLTKDIATMLTEEIGVIATHRQLYENNRVPWPQVFDDWGAFFYDNFGPITARCRSAKMPISFLFQSRGQTDRVDGNRIFTTEITDNIGSLVILRINGHDTAEWAAKQFGSYDTTELSHSQNTAYEGNNLTTMRAPRLDAGNLKNLNAGEAYINCLVTGEGGAVSNQRYKARFPLPDFSGAETIDWPLIEVEDNNDQPGLHLWRDFMDRDRLRELKKQVVKQSEDNKAPQESNTDRVREVDFL
ncbi:MAG: TraM recognition domain-containing protein [Ketobacteraceae bacterium]|nr:TraM recognition domain-containing protein [Ketobacteraceae bacterium]